MASKTLPPSLMDTMMSGNSSLYKQTMWQRVRTQGPGLAGRLGPWYSQAIYGAWATQGLLNLSSHLGSRMSEFLALSLSRASLAPPKANNLSHSSKKFAVLSLPSGYGYVCLGNPPYSHLELRGMKKNWKPEATKNISGASTPGRDL